MFKKFLVACSIAVCLILGPMMVNVFGQDASPSPSPSPTLSSPEATASPTASPEATASPTTSPEATASPTASPEATASPTASPEATASPTASPEATASPTIEASPLPVPIVPADASRQEPSAAVTESPINPGDTAWVLISSALVMLMTPGLAFFYGGLVRSRNVLNTMMMSLIAMGLVGVIWVLWGYSLSFAPTSYTLDASPAEFQANPIIGSLKWIFLNEVSFDKPDPVGYAGTIPHQMFMVYQMMFAMITPALISGAIVERISFKAYFWFIFFWINIIYFPLAHWVWGKGWIGVNLGALDVGGGTVVHISSGVSAVVAAYILGPRKTYPTQPAAPHNVPYVLLGIGLLWFGWLGFNGGSALAANSVAAVAFVTTVVSAASAGLTWVILEWVLRNKPTAIGIATGFLAGLVGITPAAGYVSPLAAILIGSITSLCCFYAVILRAKLQFDDSLDTFPVHGVGGTVGALLTGVFANKAFNSAGADGLLAGHPELLWKQFVGVVVTYLFAAVGTLVILKGLSLVMALRVKPIAEEQGLDINEHGEEGYGEEFASGLSLNK